MNPDTLIFHLAGAQCRLDITQGAVVYVGSDVRADVYLQSPHIAPAHCAIQVLANDQFRVATLDGAATLTINGETTHDMTVKAPFSMGIADQALEVRLESLEKKQAESFAAPKRTHDMSISMTRAGAPEGSEVRDVKPSFFSRLLGNGGLSRKTKIALAATLTFGGFYAVNAMWPGDGDVVIEMEANPANLSEFLRKFTLGSFSYVIKSAERVSMDDDDNFDRHYVDSSGPWSGPENENSEGTSIYAVRMEVTNLHNEEPQPFITEFALANFTQDSCDPDMGASQMLMHQLDIEPMPRQVEPGASHECIVAFKVPNEALLDMIILIASEKHMLKKIEARIGLNTQALADTMMKIANAKIFDQLVDPKMMSMDEMIRGEAATANGLLIPLGSGSSMVFRYCAAGDFIMGSPPMEEGQHASEGPTHASLTQGYWMGETECTQRQWSALLTENPSHFQGRDLPVDSVTWEQALEFIAQLNALPHLSDEWRRNWVFALPTEAQWEHACRAGTPSSFNNGTFYSRRFQNRSPAESIAWFADNTGASTQSAGTKTANAWGLHDMHGNVWEWCQDWHFPRLIGGINPEGPSNGTERVLRGGSFSSPESELRAARRNRLSPTASYSSVGFRVAIVRRVSEERSL